MKLKKFTVRNFKGIKELTMDMDNISIIIGPNNCSKSTILQALTQFGSKELQLSKHLYHKHDMSQPISFHATFTDLTEEEIEMHGIRNSIHRDSGDFIVRAVYKEGINVERASKISGPQTHDLGQEGWEGRLGGGRNGTHFLNVFPEIIYIPAVKDANDELKDKSAHMKTLFTLYKNVVTDLPEYREAYEKTQLLQQRINEHNDEKIRYFEDEVKEFLNEVTSTDVKFKVNVSPLDEIVSTSLDTNFNYNGLDTKLVHQGNGVQRTFILSVFKGFRKYKRRFEEGNIENKRPLIIALEEPELYLHPHLARVFKNTLYSLADDGFFQVIATSHSPNFVDLSKPNRTLAKVYIGEDNKVGINQVNSDVYGLPTHEKERLQALLRFNPYVNEVFFADRVILVEGDTEVIAFKVLGEKLVNDRLLNPEDYYRTTVVNCNGKGTMYVLLNILNNFGIKYTVIHDYDITEFNRRGNRRSRSSLKATLTLNHKLEKLAFARGNKKFVLRHTFEAEMPDEYEQGSSKSFSAYEFLNAKELHELPIGLLDIVKSSYGVAEIEPDHKNETLVSHYDWAEMRQALEEWNEPREEEFLIRLWDIEQEATPI
ncbi:ATP-dependent nuclease [Bacillus mycoides]|uniref:ATP-dependent nuclease n=1 Tax=Bacillus mycoides TaxID=1405 RepID=UPI001C022B89|nr:AAA family ATPase [Bacillus mycoides]MCQ6532277.1 ATP-dependent endonuclease [Bacillus mycoides]QWI54495.1 ATP-dependent endonuclease [Bacillus mycoides]QWI91112.1 ATP-dependent endonuclease [Bacillus mycoides]